MTQGKRFKPAGESSEAPVQRKSGGSHFASSGSAKAETTPKKKPERPAIDDLDDGTAFAVPAPENAPKKANPKDFKVPAAMESGRIPRIGGNDLNAPIQRKPVIAGVSGQFPVVGATSEKPARRVSAENRMYSRYNTGYMEVSEQPQLQDVVAAFNTEKVKGAPAYSWTPFLVYGVVSIALVVVWCAGVFATGASPLRGTSLEMTIGLGILVLSLVFGLVMCVATVLVSKRLRSYDTADLAASALGKTSLMMLAVVVLWIVANVVVGL